MLSKEYLEKIPEEQHEAVKSILSVLQVVKKENKMGLNVTHIQERTHLSYTSVAKALSSLSTLGMIVMEKQGSSKVYRLAEGI